MDLKGNNSLNTVAVGNWTERGDWADVWGYTAPDGTEYALVALRSSGVSIVDISGTTPTEVGFIATDTTVPGTRDSKDVKAIGHHVYLVNEFGPIQVIDISTPEAPVQVGAFSSQPTVGDGGAHNVSVDDRYLYVTGGRSNSSNAGVRIYDTQPDPASPQLVGEFQPTHFQIPYYHDFYTDGDIGYGPNIYGGGVDILDLSDRTNPTLIGTFGYPGSGAHNVCGTTDGRYMFVGDEIGSSGNWTRVFNVEDPMNVEYITDIVIDTQAVVHNCYVKGDLLHIGHYTEGYRVFDVSEPETPVEVAYYDTYPDNNFGYRGVWSVYPYFESGRVVASDRDYGLFVFELDASVVGTESPVAPGEIDLTAGPNPASGAVQVRVDLGSPSDVRLSVTDALGREVAVLHDGEAVGALRATLDTSPLAPGIYVIHLDASGETATRTILVIR